MDSKDTYVVKYAYDPWGKFTTTYNVTSVLGYVNPILYRGYLYEYNAGFYYLQSRFYDQSIGRFLNADAITDGGAGVLGTNLFMYAANNPINNSDPTGQWIIKDAVKWVAKKVHTVVKKVQKKVSNGKVAFTIGQSISGQVDRLNVGYTGSISIHINGDVNIQTAVEGSLSTSKGLGVSSQTINGIDFVPDIYDIHRDTPFVSFNATAPIPNTLISGDGSITYNQLFSNDGTKGYPSFSIGAGAAFPAPTNTEFGLSVGMSHSYDKYRFNIYDCIDKVYIKIMEW